MPSGEGAIAAELRTLDTDRGEIRFTLHTPGSEATHRVILAHGFFRNAKTMSWLAESLAESGVETACIQLKRSRPWNGNHGENARDLVALRRALGWERVIYAGFSAGGLSALIATSQDRASTRLVLLDPVDQSTLGTDAAQQIRIPTLAILGKPGPGNAQRNASGMLQAIPHAQVVEIPEAAHCDFETQPSAACHRLTGSRPDPERTARVHAQVLGVLLPFLENP